MLVGFGFILPFFDLIKGGAALTHPERDKVLGERRVLAVDEVERRAEERAAHGRADLADHPKVEVGEAAVGRAEEVA